MDMRLKSKFWGILVITSCCLASNLVAQLPQFDLDKALKLADGKKAIVLDRQEHVRVSIKKGKPEIILDYSEYVMYLNESTSAGNEISIPYSDRFFALESIEAATWIPSEKGYKRIKTDPATRSARISSELFYDDMMQAKVVFPSIVNKAITELKYTYKIQDPMFAFPYYFKPGFSVPLMHSLFRIEYSDQCDIEIKMFGDTLGIQSKQGKDGSTNYIEKWVENVAAEKAYDNPTSAAYYKPHLFYLLRSYSKNNEQVRLLGNTADLYKHNYTYIKDLNKEPCSTDLIRIADSLKTGLDQADSLAIIQRVYYWIQDHIRYVAFEDGLGGYIPRPSNAVFTKRYGDCKDKAALMQYMLKQCGIQSNLVWIGTRDIPYTYEQLPLMQSSNHMILAKKIDGNWNFYDATAEHLPIGLPSSFIQGKEAFISIDENTYEIVKVPTVNVDVNFIRDSLTMKMDENSSLKIIGNMTFGGYARWRFMSGYSNMNEKDKKEFIENFLKHNYTKAEVISYEISGTDNREIPVEITYEVKLTDYANKIDDQFYMNLHIQKPMMNEKIKEPERNSPLEYIFRYTNSLIVKFDFPEGFTSGDLPSEQKFSSDLISFDRSFIATDNGLSFESNVAVQTIQVNPDQFEEWNKAIGTLNKNFKESITLKPIKK